MVKKQAFLDIASRHIIVSTIVVYFILIVTILIEGGLAVGGPTTMLTVWQYIIFPLAAFATGWLIAKYKKQPRPEVSGIIFAVSAWLWALLTWWGWGSLFDIFLWKWWHTGSSLAVELISAFVIQLLITLFVFGKKFSAERIRVQLYLGLITLSVLMTQAYICGRSILHIMNFSSDSIVPYGNAMYAAVLLFIVFGQTIVLALAIVINTIMLYKRGTKPQQFMINNLYAFYASMLATSITVFVTSRPLHDNNMVNIWIIFGSLIVALGLDVYAMIYYRHHLPLRKG